MRAKNYALYNSVVAYQRM